MIAKIGHGANIIGALSYNQLKVDKEDGSILYLHNMLETRDGMYTVPRLAQSFEPYLTANRRTEKPVLHISLNPDPKDKLSDEKFVHIAEEYMRAMGYGEQPFVVYKHTDLERTHIHIVSVCVDEQGKKITDSFERKRSMDICRSLEQRHALIPATEKSLSGPSQIFRPVDYMKGDIKSQIAAVVRHLPQYYRFHNLGTYNALLSLFNITSEEVRGELQGQQKKGLVYFALDSRGEKVTNPFKASLFGKHAGFTWLENHFADSTEQLKQEPSRAIIKNAVEAALHMTSTEAGFRKQLQEQGISTVTRRNAENCLYGITFIDHDSKTVWNGSQLDKNLSANVFNNHWADTSARQKFKEEAVSAPVSFSQIKAAEDTGQQPHELFGFLEQPEPQHNEYGFIGGIGGLLPENLPEDYEEQDFANRMKKKKKRRQAR